MKDDAVYLRHILEAIRRIEENTAGGQAVFLASHTLQDAVLRNLQTMAAATQRLSTEAKAPQTGGGLACNLGFPDRSYTREG